MKPVTPGSCQRRNGIQTAGSEPLREPISTVCVMTPDGTGVNQHDRTLGVAVDWRIEPAVRNGLDAGWL